MLVAERDSLIADSHPASVTWTALSSSVTARRRNSALPANARDGEADAQGVTVGCLHQAM